MEVEQEGSTGLFDSKENPSSDGEPDSLLSSDVKRKRDSENAGSEYGDTPSEPTLIERSQPMEQGDTEDQEPPGPKRAKLSDTTAFSSTFPRSKRPNVHGLPPQLWKRILSLLPPVFLGRLLRVSRDFNSLLTSGVPPYGEAHESDTVDPQIIWLASHRRYAAGLPEALPGQSELDMWRLVRGNSCQLCKLSKPLLSISATFDPWRSTQEDGVRVIWPFAVRCCSSCLKDRVEQESSLHFSSSLPSFLLPTLPCVFLSEGKHYVHSSTVKSSAPPQDVQLSKVFYKPHVEDIKDGFDRKKAVDPDGAKAWISELGKDNEARTEAILKWEQWEAKGGLKKVNSRPGAKSAPLSKQPREFNRPKLQTEAAHTATDHVTSNGAAIDRAAHIPKIPESNGMLYSSGTNTSPYPLSQPLTPGGLPPRPTYQATSYRPERDLRDVTEAKASRRTEIERRCMALDPPIPENILRHMDSFQAALQIPQPLTEQAWELLKPRLLDQREAAEKEEKERLKREKASQVPAFDGASLDSQAHNANTEASTLDASQAPVQDRLSTYADERIRQLWSDGATVNKATCPTFAADILLHVKRRFDDDQKAAGRGSTSASSTENVLILEHMKWLFDNKIRPLTDPYNREIFLCSVCEGVSKYYGFEAVIQHYAAKHTSALSQGSVVVHWRAKWPDEPPFHPNPSGSVPNFTASMSAANAPQNYQPGVQPSSVVPSGSYGQGVGLNPIVHGYPSGPPPPSYVPPPYHQSGVPVQYSDPYVSAPAGQHSIPQPYPTAALPSPHGPPPALNLQHSSQWPSQQSPIGPPQQGAFAATQLYQSQMNDLAKFAREIWFSTSGVKEMPASLRIYVVIQHVANRFAQTYSTEPSLAMFLEGLNQNPLMRPVRSLNGLMCKTCFSQSGHVSRSEGERKVFTLPLLLNHFKNVHLENPGEAVHLNWKNDMVQLPESSTMQSLISAPGMDQTKLALITQVLPEVFSFPMPSVGPYHAPTTMQSGQGSASASHAVQGGSFPTSEIGSHVAPLEKISGASRRSRSRTKEVEAAGEDEYDPHRPAYLEVGQAGIGWNHSSAHSSDSKERRTARSRPNWPVRHTETTGVDYDPNEPLISYDREQAHYGSQSRYDKPEGIEADRFLEKLKPEIEKGYAPLERAAGVPEASTHADPYRRQHHTGGPDPSQDYYQQDSRGHGRPYLDRGEFADYKQHGPPPYYDYPPDDQRVYARDDIYHAPRGLYVESERPPAHVRERERADPDPLVRDAPATRPVRYYPAVPAEPPRREVVYVAHSPDNYAPVHYRAAPAQYAYPPEHGHGPRPGDRYEERGRHVQRIPVEDYSHGPRYPSPRGHARAHAVEGEMGRAYGEGMYSSRPPPPVEGEERVFYREHR